MMPAATGHGALPSACIPGESRSRSSSPRSPRRRAGQPPFGSRFCADHANESRAFAGKTSAKIVMILMRGADIGGPFVHAEQRQTSDGSRRI